MEGRNSCKGAQAISHIFFKCQELQGEICIRKKHVLTSLLLLLAILLAVLLLLFLTYPITHETFTVPHDQETIKELNLKAGSHVSIWLWTASPGSMQNAGGRVIKFFVTDPNQSDLGVHPLGVAGTGYFTPFTFVAQQDGIYDMHFENSIGEADSRTVSLYYRVALSIFGIPVEYILICILAAAIVLAITLGIISRTSKERKPKPQVNPS